MTTASDLIVLIPGFLGYDRFGDFTYFKETVGDALRAGLADQGLSKGIAVTAVTTDPAGSLESRQASLVTQLSGLLERRPGVRLHLVGHSTGGLDAELLLRTPLLAPSLQKEADKVRPAIHSIVAIAAPLAGTSVSDTPIARFFALQSPADFLKALGSKLLYQLPGLLLHLGDSLAGLVRDDSAVAPLLNGLLHGTSSSSTFVLDLILRRSLATDLAPKRVASVLAEAREDPAYAHVHRARFITVARSVPKKTPASELFTLFYDSVRKAAKDDPVTHALGAELQLLAEQRKLPVIGQGELPVPIDEKANDGIVNSARQLFALPAGKQELELARVKALVIADHLDVVGYFEGKNGQASGFLSSGSHFREPELDALYRAVAGEVGTAIAAVGERQSNGNAGPHAQNVSL